MVVRGMFGSSFGEMGGDVVLFLGDVLLVVFGGT